jgi:hypothetical protein
MHYIVEEDKEKKEYIVPVKNKSGGLHYLIQRIAEIPEGEEVVLECKRNGAKNYIEVIPVNAVSAVERDEEEENDNEAPQIPF